MAYVSGRRRRRLFSSSSYRLQKVSIGISVTNSPCSKLESGVLWCKFFQAQRVCVGLAEKTLPARHHVVFTSPQQHLKKENDYLRFNGRPIPSTQRLVSHWCCTHNPTGEECVNRWTCGYNPGGIQLCVGFLVWYDEPRNVLATTQYLRPIFYFFSLYLFFIQEGVLAGGLRPVCINRKKKRGPSVCVCSWGSSCNDVTASLIALAPGAPRRE